MASTAFCSSWAKPNECMALDNWRYVSLSDTPSRLVLVPLPFTRVKSNVSYNLPVVGSLTGPMLGLVPESRPQRRLIRKKCDKCLPQPIDERCGPFSGRYVSMHVPTNLRTVLNCQSMHFTQTTPMVITERLSFEHSQRTCALRKCRQVLHDMFRCDYIPVPRFARV